MNHCILSLTVCKVIGRILLPVDNNGRGWDWDLSPLKFFYGLTLEIELIGGSILLFGQLDELAKVDGEINQWLYFEMCWNTMVVAIVILVMSISSYQ